MVSKKRIKLELETGLDTFKKSIINQPSTSVISYTVSTIFRGYL